MSFLGEYEVTLDAKGRFSLPVGFRKQIPSGEEARGFVVSRGMGKFLNLYTRAEWDAYAAKVSRLSDYNPETQKLKRLLLSGATELHPDSAGRVLIPKQLQAFAGFNRTLIFSAIGNKVEIWDKAKYDEFLEVESSRLEDLGKSLFGDGLLDPFDPPSNPS